MSDLIPIKVPSDEFTKGMHFWQKDFLNRFDSGKARFSMLKWHRRSRKTTLAINLLIRECMHNPKRRYVYISPTYAQSKSIIWTDPNMLFKWLPPEELGLWTKNESELFIKFKNGSILSLKGSKDINTCRGIDAHGVVFDEFALHDPKVWGEIFRPIMIQDPDRWALFIYTPKPANFCKEMYAKARLDENTDWHASCLPASRSHILPHAELVKAKKEMLTGEYEQEMECSDLAEEERLLITPRMLEDLQNYNYSETSKRRIISIDPSGGGDDCVIYYVVNGEKIDEKILKEKDSMKIAGHAIILAKKYKCNNFIVDNIGVGWGVADRLREQDFYVQDFNSSHSSGDKKRFLNLRAEGWFNLMEKIQNHEIPYIEDRKLVKDLISVCYEVIDSSGKMKMESKKLVKKKLGHSPDRGDSYVYAMYGLQYVDEEGDDYRTPLFNANRRRNKKRYGTTFMSA